MYIIGEKVKGGLYGTYPNLQDLDNNAGLRMRVDFRSVYTTMIQECVGFRFWPIQAQARAGLAPAGRNSASLQGRRLHGR